MTRTSPLEGSHIFADVPRVISLLAIVFLFGCFAFIGRPGKDCPNGGKFSDARYAHVLQPFAEGALVKQGVYKWRIHSYTCEGNRRSESCDDEYLARFDGPAIVIPRVRCVQGGTYEFSARLEDLGDYSLTIRLLETGVNRLYENLCANASVPHSYIVGGQRPPIKFSVVKDKRYRPRTVSCDAEDFYYGRWVPRQTSYAFGTPQDFQWLPYSGLTCNWPAFWDVHDVRECTRGRWVLFVGDHTMQELAASYALLAFTKNLIRADEPRCLEEFQQYHVFDTDFDVHGSRVTFFFANSPDPCKKTWNGLDSMFEPKFHRRIARLIEGPRRPDVVFFTGGLHDIHTSTYFDYAKFNGILRANLRRIPEYGPRIVYKTSPAKVGEFECLDHRATNAMVAKLNRISTSSARIFGYPIADQYTMSLAFPKISDGHHCTTLFDFGLDCELSRNCTPPAPPESSPGFSSIWGGASTDSSAINSTNIWESKLHIVKEVGGPGDGSYVLRPANLTLENIALPCQVFTLSLLNFVCPRNASEHTEVLLPPEEERIPGDDGR